MTLNEAIEHAEEVARTCDDSQCARDHRRLARWLTELKMARESAFAEIPQMARTISENHDLKAENAKLRELCSDMFTDFANCDFELMRHGKTFMAVTRYFDRLCELGIEVRP